MPSISLDASTKLGEVRQGANKATYFLSFFKRITHPIGIRRLNEAAHT